ncbi:hypothetical protein NUH30_19190 [Leptospira sp. 85282-16]|nr:hypothetical protein [Leptospira sp. 85282-16]MCT8335820.1 hypothetical protein [Leptospira sp. 85282-16]
MPVAKAKELPIPFGRVFSNVNPVIPKKIQRNTLIGREESVSICEISDR